MMPPDLWELYRQMQRSRLFEKAVLKIWEEGKISGEMHLGMGEEAIAAGVVTQLQEGDAMALDHRATPQLVMRWIDLVSLLREFLGYEEGLCRGMGGHMHLLSKEHLAASSGIVGASGPAALGFALAARQLRPGTVAVAFFGEGAVNQGMMMESLNLAVVWELPVIFVCKDNEWAITTPSPSVTAGKLVERARSFGMPAESLDGTDVEVVWHAAQRALDRARRGCGPTFIHARCVHLEGHFLGDPLLRVVHHPLNEMMQVGGSIFRSIAKLKGASLRARADGLRIVTSLIGKATREHLSTRGDPLAITRQKLVKDKERLLKLEEEVSQEIDRAVQNALKSEGGGQQ